MVGGEGFAVDASLIKADANRQKGIEGDKGLPPEAAGRACMVDNILKRLKSVFRSVSRSVSFRNERILSTITARLRAISAEAGTH